MSLTAAQWSQVEALFGDALELPPAQRGQQLDRAAVDPAVRAEVEALLLASDGAGDFLARPATIVSTQAAIDYCLQHPQWRLSVQTHKSLGIR